MTRTILYGTAAVAAVALAVLLYGSLSGPAPSLDGAVSTGSAPRIRPDCSGVTLPPNIAPLNFVVEEPGERYAVRIRSHGGEPISIHSDDPSIIIPAGAWRRLLEANRGQELVVEVAIQTSKGAWHRFLPLTARIAAEPIDRYLVYRLIRPIYNKYKRIGIYQRDLEGYGESAILKNAAFGHGCVNCHTFCPKDPSRMVLHVRSPFGAAMVLVRDGRVAKVDTRTGLSRSPAAYSSWHPSGRLLAFSMNELSQMFHTVGENRDVFDARSDLGLYLVDSNTVTTTDAISLPDRNETWPAWSADGRHLYFSAAPRMPKERFREVRYDLMRIGYDADTDSWGNLETLVAAEDTGRTSVEPRPSPDGRWLLFAMCDYGSFPIYQPSCDLYLRDLATGEDRPLACNSPRCDSYHSWSSNSRWIVFTSKRRDGVFAQPYFSYIDADGRAHKPFVLPQRDPTFYDSCLKTYNAPELSPAPVAVPRREFGRVIRTPEPDEDFKAMLDPRIPPRVSPTAEPPWKPTEPYEQGGQRRGTEHPGG